MKKYLMLAMVIAGLIVIAGCENQERAAVPHKGQPAGEARDIVETLNSAGDFKTLIKALKAADLVDTLKGKGPYTVFAPTDKAFAQLPAGKLDDLLKPANKAELRKLLRYHVVSGNKTAADITKMDTIRTLEGKRLNIKTRGDTVMINEARVEKPDLRSSNGVIHVINKVLQP